MYKVIMVPTDGSGFDREAIRVALRIAERTDAKVRLVRVLATGSIFDMAAKTDGTDTSDEIVQTGRDAALSELYALAAECRAISKASITVDLHGGPIDDVLQGYARRHDVDTGRRNGCAGGTQRMRQDHTHPLDSAFHRTVGGHDRFRRNRFALRRTRHDSVAGRIRISE